MFTPTKTQRACAAYARAVRRLIRDTFDLSDEEIIEQSKTWDAWCKLKPRNSTDLTRLVESDMKDAFKARALAILLSPNPDCAVFGWRQSKSGSLASDVASVLKYKRLSPKLVRYVCSMLELGLGELQNMTFENRRGYNMVIRRLLATLPEDDEVAKRLFALHHIPVFELVEERHDKFQSEFHALLAANIPDVWKERADAERREVVAKEKETATQVQYIASVRACFYGHSGKFPYGREILASQLQFVFGLPDGDKKFFSIFYGSEVPMALRALTGETHKHLRRMIFLRMYQCMPAEYGAWSTAEIALEDLGEEEPELRAKLRQFIADCQARAAASDAVRAAERAAEDERQAAILAKMR